MIVRKGYSKIVILALAVLLFFVAFASLFFGQIEIPIKNTISVIGYQLGVPFFDKSDFTQEQMAVIWYIRMPRMLV